MGRLTTILVEDDDTYKEDAGPKILGQRDARAGVSFALLGEFGPLAADLMWVRAYQEWSAELQNALDQP